ncbi:MAG: hypothetical protein IJO63_03890 [Bacilli bacterium]|nr:hypothetical protein [Bacilli bacterium]
MNINMEKVFERDIDLLMINKFVNENKTCHYFSSKIGIENYLVESLQHSLMDENGESDITVILNNGSKKIAFLIEDKIDAIAMPNQRGRYDIRGNKGIKNKEYEEYFVFIIAPKEYLDSNEEAKKYENQISYEELVSLFEEDLYAKTLLEQAIEEKKKGYIIIENQNVTLFWDNYYHYININYPSLNINKVDGPRGSRASWPIFNTPIKKIKIRHKSDRGYMDLEFAGLANKYYELYDLVKDYLDEDMTLEITNKSVSIRLLVPVMDFTQEFTNYISEMEICMNSVIRLEKLLKKLNLKEIEKLGS